MPDFSRSTFIWVGGHGLERATQRNVTPQEAEELVRDSSESDQEPQKRKGRWKVWGCVRSRRTWVIVEPRGNATCLVITVVRKTTPCA